MPDKPLTIATYAAGISLAAITLIYVFGPTYFIHGSSSKTSNSLRKRGVVGLSNPANDCFINSILQCLAGLEGLRAYLIRATHRRKLNGLRPDHNPNGGSANERATDLATEEGLGRGIVTQALQEILDNLNERPLGKRTVSAGTFVTALERAFRQRISRQQQDAQEFLQIVAERLCEEYHAGQRARRKPKSVQEETEDVEDDCRELIEEENGFPLEGTLESQIECLKCHFKPRPSSSTFVTLTLNVPQQSSTTLSNCLDGLLKTEYIDDFKCEKCRLVHAVETRLQQLAKTKPTHVRGNIEAEISKLEQAIQEDPEIPPENVPLPGIYSRIAKHVRVTTFPEIISIHLSRSIFDPGSASMKNSAKVSFPEQLSLGGILDRMDYKLLGLVCHRGGHNSGHYESFRRQIVYTPYSTSNNNSGLGSEAASDENEISPAPSLTVSSRIKPDSKDIPSPETSSTGSPADPESTVIKATSTTPSKPSSPKSTSKRKIRNRNKNKLSDRWWRISDENVKESKTSEVLSMQKEVYILFYQLEKPHDGNELGN
ncbi:MAG: hypothetical protein M1816_003563 [Peltula sp. TS41687]|nr:MAG: hypothetical protein M1816_003563 [Peltula sp. TS41687]